MKKIVFLIIIVTLAVVQLSNSTLGASASTGCELIGERSPIGDQWIEGPAILQLYPYKEGSQYNDVIVVFPGAGHYHPLPWGGTIWEYEGDETCLRNQYEFFENFEIIEVHKDIVYELPEEGCELISHDPLSFFWGWVEGPAIIQFGTFYAPVVSIFPGARYYKMHHGAVWKYEGDGNCLRSQYEYFEDFEIFEVEAELRHLMFLPLIIKP